MEELADEIRRGCTNRKITITGGEPLYQKEALLELVKLLGGFDICVYTSYELEEVPEELLRHIRYIKTGRYEKDRRCTTRPYVGSTNQRFIEIGHRGT